MSDKQQTLDQILRQKLEELPTPDPQPVAWDRLSASLDNPSDAAIAAALNGLTPPVPTGGWDAMREKLDDALGREVDAIVSRHLAQEAGRVSGWAALAARLELISHRRQLIGAWKVTEVCLLASLLLLLLRFGPAQEANSGPLAESNTGFPMEAVTGNETPAEVKAEVQDLPTTPEPSTAFGTADVLEPEAMLPAERVVLSARPSVRSSSTVDPITGPHYLAAAGPSALRLPSPALDGLSGPRYAAKWGATLPSPILELPKIDNSIPVRYHLNLFVSPLELNEVITPQSAVGSGDIIGRNELTNSVSVGALLDISKGNDGIQVGAVYGIHGYTPTALALPNCAVLEDCPEGFNRFIYHSVNFSFSYERSLLNSKNWRIAPRAGMAMSVITQSEFKQTLHSEENLPEALAAPAPPRPTPGRSRELNTIQPSELLDPEAGWFEGGSLLSNSSFYLQAGLTIERSFTPRFSVYVSPSYDRVIYLRESQGVGPYNDRIHRASLRLGSRFLLSGK